MTNTIKASKSEYDVDETTIELLIEIKDTLKKINNTLEEIKTNTKHIRF